MALDEAPFSAPNKVASCWRYYVQINGTMYCTGNLLRDTWGGACRCHFQPTAGNSFTVTSRAVINNGDRIIFVVASGKDKCRVYCKGLFDEHAVSADTRGFTSNITMQFSAGNNGCILHEIQVHNTFRSGDNITMPWKMCVYYIAPWFKTDTDITTIYSALQSTWSVSV